MTDTTQAAPTPERTAKAVQLAEARRKARKAVKNTGMTALESINGLEPNRSAKVAERLAEIPQKCRLAYLRAVAGKSRAAGIRAFCAECMGWEGLPSSVRSCTAPACPLFAYRPFQAGRRAGGAKP